MTRCMPGSQVLGAKRKALAGFSSTTAQPHQGFIFQVRMVLMSRAHVLVQGAARLVRAASSGAELHV